MEIDKTLVERARELFEGSARRILVTGATGFIGRRLAETMHLAGQDVTATGRNRYLAPSGVRFERADVRDRDRIEKLVGAHDIVVHCAADTSLTASLDDLYDTNVLGTQNVVNACSEAGVQRLVHLSTSAIQFQFEDQFDVSEDTPLPSTQACGYSESKRQAEGLIRTASQMEEGLRAVIVRSPPVFGPGDNSFFPRLARIAGRARAPHDRGSGATRLSPIGTGNNIRDLTYVDNLVYGLVLAVTRPDASGTFTITGGRPIQLWSLVSNVLSAAGYAVGQGSVSAEAAMLRADAANRAAWFSRKVAPALPKMMVGMLTYSQTFSADHAQDKLGYEPIVSMQDAAQRTVDSLVVPRDPEGPCVKVTLRTTGYAHVRLSRVQSHANARRVALHSLVGIIRHPEHGVTLFDTGMGPRYFDTISRYPFVMASRALDPVFDEAHTALATVQREGIAVEDVRRIVISHFHIDHMCGLRDFPNADFIATREAWEAVRRVRGMSALRAYCDLELLPPDFEDRLHLFTPQHGSPIGPIPHSHDLFGDGSVRMVPLPGHAPGQIGLLLKTDARRRKFLISDASWTRESVLHDLPLTRAYRFIAHDSHAASATQKQLHDLANQQPDIELIPSHCPSVANQYGFNKLLDDGT